MRFLFAMTALSAGSPALATDATAVSEPSTMVLFALGTIGVIVGRQLAKRRPSDDD